jgi:putative membrane protein
MWLSVAVAIGFVAASVVAGYWHGLRRLFTSKREMMDETARAADHIFVSRRLASTRDRGGLLIYVSLAERRVVVLADEGLLKAAGQPFLDELRDLAVSRLREGNRVEAFTDTLKAAGEKLPGFIPLQKNDANELGNRLLVFRSRP